MFFVVVIIAHFMLDKKETYFPSSVCPPNGKLTIKMTLIFDFDLSLNLKQYLFS